MGHYIILDQENDMEVPGAFISIVLDWLKSEASSVESLWPLVGVENYEWNKSIKVLPLSDLEKDGVEAFTASLKSMLKNLDEVAAKWNDPSFKGEFRVHGEALLAKIEALRNRRT